MQYVIDGEEFVDVDEAATLLGVKKATLYAYVSRGVLQSYRQHVGRRRLYRRAEIEALRVIQPSHAPPTDEHQHVQPPPSTNSDPTDDVIRDVHLPDVASWAGDH
jgi:excisionase family DNA binding protein